MYNCVYPGFINAFNLLVDHYFQAINLGTVELELDPVSLGAHWRWEALGRSVSHPVCMSLAGHYIPGQWLFCGVRGQTLRQRSRRQDKKAHFSA